MEQIDLEFDPIKIILNSSHVAYGHRAPGPERKIHLTA